MTIDPPSNIRYDVEREEFAQEYDPVDWPRQSAQSPKSAAKKTVFERVSSGSWPTGEHEIRVHHDGEYWQYTVCAQPTIDVWIDDLNQQS